MGTFVEIKRPVDRRSLVPLPDSCKRVQLEPAYADNDPGPTDRDFELISEFLADYPKVWLRVYGHRTVKDLEFLRFFSQLRRFEVDVFELKDFSGLRFLPDDLEELAIGATRARTDISLLKRFRNLSYLYLEGHGKGIDTIAGLDRLEWLSLRSITLPDLSLLTRLPNLRDLEIRLGGTKDLRHLPEISKLRYLHLWLVRGLTDVSAIGEVPALQNLLLQALKNVNALPSFKKCAMLRRVVLYQMKGLNDLGSLATAPALQELAVLSMPHLSASAFKPLAQSETLVRLDLWLRNKAKHAEVRAILGPRVNDERGEFSPMLRNEFEYV